MAFRGRGRGRGGFRGGFYRAGKEEPFKLFPEGVALPDRKCVALDEDFFRWSNKLRSYFENSAYYVEDSASGDNRSHDIERYSDLSKPRNTMKRESLSDYMKLQPGYFPRELIQGMKSRPQKKVKWNTDQDSKSLDMLFDKIGKKAKEKNEENKGENDDDDEEDGEEKEEDNSSGGDYEQNEDFDDDDDDFNANDDGDDEPFY